MITGYSNFKKFSDNKKIKMTNKRFDVSLQIINFLQIDNLSDLSSQVIDMMKQSNLIVIDIFTNDNYDIFCFDEYLIIIKKTNISIFEKLKSNIKSSFCNFYWIPDLEKQNLGLEKYSFLNFDEYYNFNEEINEFIGSFQICYIYEKSILQFWKTVNKCIAGFLIKKAYIFCTNKRLNIYASLDNEYIKKGVFSEDDFVTLRFIDKSEKSSIYLGYHIESCNLVSIKKINSNQEDRLKIIKREINNYKKIQYPFIPKYYGIIENEDDKDQLSLVIEFIYGKNLLKISKTFLSLTSKLAFIIQLLFVFQYLHQNKFIYRDLKPNNIMIDKNGDIVLIDYDRMLNEDEIKDKNNIDFTREFTVFAYPELDDINNKPSYSCDIYSIGMIIKYLFTKEFPSFEDQIENKDFEAKYPFIYKYLYKKCINVKNENITITDLISNLTKISNQENSDEVSKTTIQNINELINQYKFIDNEMSYVPKLQYHIGLSLYEGNIVPKNLNKAIHYLKLSAKNNFPDALYKLGVFYLNGKYFKQNINKAIEYFTKASDLNHSLSQLILGENYIRGTFFQKDIYKGIKYLEMCSNDLPLSQYLLGSVYSFHEFNNYDINKAIHYFTKAAENNLSEAQNALGIIYRDGIDVKRDIKKSIYHFSLGVKGDSIESQYNLGVIYLEGKYVKQDVDKAIYLFTLAANKNHPSSLYNLGCIYGGEVISYKDINKALYYFQRAADFNHTFAQRQIGLIYYKGDCVMQNISKAIQYLMLSANNNDSISQYYLGKIYYKEKYHLKNIDKAIQYFTMAVGKKHSILLRYLDKTNIEDIKYKNVFMLELRNNDDIKLYEKKSLFYLGDIYLKEKLSQKDKDKGINYLKLAAINNSIKSQIYLFEIYYHGYFAVKDDKLAIFYLQMAENQKNPLAQYLFGKYYYQKNDFHEKEKSIYYFELAANQDYSDALFFLGYLYHDGIIVQKDINKAIELYLRAAKKNNSDALFGLGIIYLEGENEQSDINKSINFLLQSAKLNNAKAEFFLGLIYLKRSSIDKGLYFINKSANRNFKEAQLLLGDIYLAGFHVEKNIEKAIILYKEVSNINNSHAKNNLGIIYKVGTDKIQANAYHAKEYLTEAIRNKNDFVAKYNLATIIYVEEEEKSNYSHEDSIKLLIESSIQKFIHSQMLLCFILFKIYGKINYTIIHDELKKYSENDSEELAKIILANFILYYSFILLNRKINIDDIIKSYLNKNYILILEKIYSYETITKTNFNNDPKSKPNDINSEFYQGFGIDDI